MANQYTKAEEEGREKPKGTNAYVKGTRDKMDPKQKDAIRAEFAAKKLEAHVNGKLTLSDSQVSACKALMPYGKSTFSSITETPAEKPQDEAEIMAQLAHLIASKPAILAPLIQADPGVRAALTSLLTGSPAVVEHKSAA